MISITAFANELTLDRNTARVGEAVSITVSLEDAFAAVDTINVPVQNLTIDGAPSVSSEFSWINGTVVRRKVFRFTAHPTAPGAALAGPLALIGEGGQREVLPPVAMRVVPDLAAASNDATTILRELVATGRDPFFVVVSLDKPRVHVGEAVVVTWTLYNAANVQDYRITKVPKLPDFWSEELDVRSEVPQHEVVDDRVLQKLVIRRVALFPLRSGRLTIASMEMNAAVMHRIDSGPFGMFEGSLVEVRYPSAQITVDVLPLPAGTSADVIGDVSIACGTPAQKSGGPVVVDVSLAGRANLRGAAPPRWAGSIGGDVQLQEGRVVLDKDSADVRMTRSWKFLIFPERGGRLSLPPLETTAYDPASGERRTLRCEATSLEVSTVAAPPHALPSGTPSAGLPFSRRVVLGTAGTLLATALLALLVMPRLARQQRVRAAARRIIDGRSPAEIREQLLALISARRLDPSALLAEEGERGEAWRAVRSILDAVERDRVQAADAEDEIELRVREFVQSLR
jgi:hypothetical protein